MGSAYGFTNSLSNGLSNRLPMRYALALGMTGSEGFA